MKARLIRIGNSKGVRLPKALLEAEPNQIVIRSAHVPREGWDSAFALMAQRGDDAMDEDAGSLPSFDETEWQW